MATDQINHDLEKYGKAQVMAFLLPDPDRSPESVRDHLENAFLPARESLLYLKVSSIDPFYEREIPQYLYFPNLQLVIGTVNTRGLNALEVNEIVEVVMGTPPLSFFKPYATGPAPAPVDLTWGLSKLGVSNLWNATYKGGGVTIGHIDSGVNPKHPALSESVTAFAIIDIAGHVDEVQDPQNEAIDRGEHGTHTAGTLVGRQLATGSVGVAPEAHIVSASILEGDDLTIEIIRAIEWAISKKVQIINLSAGVPGEVEDFRPLVERIRDEHQVLLVVAIGNDGVDRSSSPGNYASVLSVGACDCNLAVAAFSSSAEFPRRDDPIVPDLLAPGVRVRSAIPGDLDQYQKMTGTSQAAPHVAGLAALLWSAIENPTPARVENAIRASCPRFNMPKPRAIAGLPNAERALQALIDDGGIPKKQMAIK